MTRYVTRRLLLLVPVLFGVSIIAFLLIRFAPGDPVTIMLGTERNSPELVERLRRELGLDRPLPVQYVLWLGRAVQGDLGRSLISNKPVIELVLQSLPVTMTLAVAALTVALVVSLPVGTLAAAHKDSIFDGISRLLSMIGIAMPIFWFGLLLLALFALSLKVLPPVGDTSRFGWQAIILPSLVLGIADAAVLTRLLRSELIEIFHEDYVRTAWAKGLRAHQVRYGHALKNAMLPVVTVLGLQFSRLLAGAVVVETIFDMNGLGQLIVRSFSTRDYPVVQGCILLIGLVAVLVNLAVDLLYVLLDPRVRYAT